MEPMMVSGASGGLWGLSTAAWTAIGTIALAGISALYVVLTLRLARSTFRTAGAAEKAAAHAEAAARVAAEENALAEAQIDVGFKALYYDVTYDQDFPGGLIMLTSETTSVYVHRVTVDYLYTGSLEVNAEALKGKELSPLSSTPGPPWFPKGSGATYGWPGTVALTKSSETLGGLAVESSFSPDGAVRSRSVRITWDDETGG